MPTEQQGLENKSPSANNALQRVTRLVFLNAVLFTAGNVLTTGGFLSYFGNDIRPKPAAIQIAYLQIAQETGTFLGLFAVTVIAWMGGRRSSFFYTSFVARLLSVGIPWATYYSASTGMHPVTMMAIFLAASQGVQAISYAAYLSWLAEIVPEDQRGRFFATRNIGNLCTMLVIPLAAGYGRDLFKGYSAEWLRFYMFIAFHVGIGMLLLSLIPMIFVPVPRSEPLPATSSDGKPQSNTKSGFWSGFPARASLKYLLASCWFAFWSGSTQTVLFKFRVDVLKVEYSTYVLLETMMRLLQIPVSRWAGVSGDQLGHVRVLLVGVMTTAAAVLFYMLATPEMWWWIVPAHVLFAGWACVNVAGPVVAMRYASRETMTRELAWYQSLSGVCGGVAGLIGAACLDTLIKRFPAIGTNVAAEATTAAVSHWPVTVPFLILFGCSFVGRLSSVFLFAWLPPTKLPDAAPGTPPSNNTARN